jgi:hypothetical protein
MQFVTKTASRFILLISLLLLSADGIADADTLEAQEKALKVIVDFADRLCTTIPLKGDDKKLELTGNAKAELNELLKKVANLGIEGAAKYQTSEWQGVLQQDLAGQLNNSRNCKLEVYKDLKDKLLPSRGNTSEDKPPPPPINITGIWRDTSGNMSQITQQGETFRFTTRGPSCIGGTYQSSGSGTIRGTLVESSYKSLIQSTLPSEGQCSGTVSPDGMQMTSTCYDSVCGQFTLSGVRQ